MRTRRPRGLGRGFRERPVDLQRHGRDDRRRQDQPGVAHRVMHNVAQRRSVPWCPAAPGSGCCENIIYMR